MRNPDPSVPALHALFEHSRARATDALADPAGKPCDAVAWLSAHVAAAEHAVYPALPNDESTARLRRAARHLLLGVRELEQACNGGPLPASATTARIRSHLLEALASFTALEQELLDRFTAQTDDAVQARLAERYTAALLVAPTRPHPHGPHRGRLERLTFAFDRFRDSALDVMDGRSTPLPRRAPRPPRRLGRWGRYALGATEPVAALRRSA
jgi:hypothetical protein